MPCCCPLCWLQLGMALQVRPAACALFSTSLLSGQTASGAGSSGLGRASPARGPLLGNCVQALAQLLQGDRRHRHDAGGVDCTGAPALQVRGIHAEGHAAVVFTCVQPVTGTPGRHLSCQSQPLGCLTWPQCRLLPRRTRRNWRPMLLRASGRERLRKKMPSFSPSSGSSTTCRWFGGQVEPAGLGARLRRTEQAAAKLGAGGGGRTLAPAARCR